MWWKNWLITRLGCLVTVAGPRRAHFFHGGIIMGIGRILIVVVNFMINTLILIILK